MLARDEAIEKEDRKAAKRAIEQNNGALRFATFADGFGATPIRIKIAYDGVLNGVSEPAGLAGHFHMAVGFEAGAILFGILGYLKGVYDDDVAKEQRKSAYLLRQLAYLVDHAMEQMQACIKLADYDSNSEATKEELCRHFFQSLFQYNENGEKVDLPLYLQKHPVEAFEYLEDWIHFSNPNIHWFRRAARRAPFWLGLSDAPSRQRPSYKSMSRRQFYADLASPENPLFKSFTERLKAANNANRAQQESAAEKVAKKLSPAEETAAPASGPSIDPLLDKKLTFFERFAYNWLLPKRSGRFKFLATLWDASSNYSFYYWLTWYSFWLFGLTAGATVTVATFGLPLIPIIFFYLPSLLFKPSAAAKDKSVDQSANNVLFALAYTDTLRKTYSQLFRNEKNFFNVDNVADVDLERYIASLPEETEEKYQSSTAKAVKRLQNGVFLKVARGVFTGMTIEGFITTTFVLWAPSTALVLLLVALGVTGPVGPIVGLACFGIAALAGVYFGILGGAEAGIHAKEQKVLAERNKQFLDASIKIEKQNARLRADLDRDYRAQLFDGNYQTLLKRFRAAKRNSDEYNRIREQLKPYNAKLARLRPVPAIVDLAAQNTPFQHKVPHAWTAWTFFRQAAGLAMTFFLRAQTGILLARLVFFLSGFVSLLAIVGIAVSGFGTPFIPLIVAAGLALTIASFCVWKEMEDARAAKDETLVMQAKDRLVIARKEQEALIEQKINHDIILRREPGLRMQNQLADAPVPGPAVAPGPVVLASLEAAVPLHLLSADEPEGGLAPGVDANAQQQPPLLAAPVDVAPAVLASASTPVTVLECGLYAQRNARMRNVDRLVTASAAVSMAPVAASPTGLAPA